MEGEVVRVLREIAREGPISPGDATRLLNLPRYKILSAFSFLEELGLVKRIYSRGTYKIYDITVSGKKLLEAIDSGYDLSFIIERGLESLGESQGHGVTSSKDVDVVA